MVLDVSGIFAQTMSHAKRLGIFNQVLSHEPKSGPAQGITCCLWATSYRSLGEVSGLASTSMRLQLNGRIYINFKAQPEDEIDKRLLDATSKFIESFNGDIQLGGEAMEVDLFGSYGDPLSARWGYVEIDRINYRIADLTIPFVIADIYTQAD